MIFAVKDTAYANLTLDEVNNLLPQMAKWIPMEEVLAECHDQSWKTFKSTEEWTLFYNALPFNHPVRKQWDLGVKAADLIRGFCENNLVDNQDVLRVLVAGLSVPVYYTRSDSFAALTSLTDLYDGPLTSVAYITPGNDWKLLVDWFGAWLKESTTKQLILTSTWKEKLKRRFISVCRCVETSSSTQGAALHGFKAPGDELHHHVGEPIFDLLWTGGPLETFRVPPNGGGWLYACVRSQTPLIHTIKGWERWPWDVPAKLPRDAKLAYKEDIAGTDWAVEIYTKNVPEQELSQLTKALETNQNVEDSFPLPQR
jgi:hypothetical protein